MATKMNEKQEAIAVIKPTRREQETIVLFDEDSETATIYTHNPKLRRKLRLLSEKHPDKIALAWEDEYAASYSLPKQCVTVREPYSDARRKADSARARAAGLLPPGREARECE